MISLLKDAIWKQFGASIDMLINVVINCPDTYFLSHKRFYYIAYHSAIFLDYYLTFPPKDFSPILPFTQMEEDLRPKEAIDDLIPDKIYSKQELVNYLQLSRTRCKNILDGLTDDNLHKRFTEGSEPNDMDFPIVEILLYNLRHTQHHVAQLNMLIRQDLNKHVEWSFRVGDLN